jgi:hypothetical protein
MTAEDTTKLSVLLERAKKHKMSEAEIHEQAIGWIVGNSPEGYRPTREQVLQSLKRA